jgi:predicted DNA-binding transcriptional regulator YafY
MKAERLLAILTILLNRKKVSAPQLAKELEVSLRTIYRDVEALAESGIPVFATQGRDGGFELMEGFTMDSHLFETGEITRIIAGLRGLSSIYPGPDVAGIIEKFSLMLKDSEKRGIRVPDNAIFIELTPSRREKSVIDAIQESIADKTVIAIDYTDARGEPTARDFEPQALVFIWQSWYVWGWCRLRKDFRLFKLSRITSLAVTGEKREQATADLSAHPWNREWESSPFREIVISADKKARSRLGEFFDADAISETDEGRLKARACLPVDEWVISFLMSLPGEVRVLEPEELKVAIRTRAENILQYNAAK